MMLESGNNVEDINLLNFFDWYNFSLLQHGRNMLKMALEIIPKIYLSDLNFRVFIGELKIQNFPE